jgi:hypothetical protein
VATELDLVPVDDVTDAAPGDLLTSPAAPVGWRRSGATTTVAVLAAWGALVAVGRWWGLRLLVHGRRLELPQPPLLGRSGPGLTPRLAVPVAVAVVLVAALPWAARRLRWSGLLVATVAGSAAWAVGLAFVDGPTWTDGLTRGLTGRNELGADVTRVAAHPARFLATFSRDIAQYHVQVRGHPPGMILVLVALRDVGLSGPGWAAALCIAAGCAAAAVVLVAARLVAGEEGARRAAPFVVLSPAAIWIATSTDAFLLLVAAVTVTVALAALRPTSARSDRLAVAAGVGFVACLLLSYGLVLVAVVPVVVAWRRRRARPLVVMAIVTVAGLGIFGLSGFWWPAGLLATRHQYDVLRVSRPYWYFVLADLSAWALVLGPALAVALVRLDGWPGGWRWWRSGTRRGDGVALLVAGGLAAVLVADLSGMSEAEVERIWLPFGAWVLLAGAALAGRRARPWLALQAASAVVLVALVTTQW